MKTYLITTGALFGLITLAHVWRVIAEWHPPLDSSYMLGMTALILLPGALAWWAFRLLRTLSKSA